MLYETFLLVFVCSSRFTRLKVRFLSRQYLVRICELLKINNTWSTSPHFQSNEMVESLNRPLEEHLCNLFDKN